MSLDKLSNNENLKQTCGNCCEFFENSNRCGNPMVYLNHTDNQYKTMPAEKACGFFYPIFKYV